MLYVDIPTSDEFGKLAHYRASPCVSIYVPTTAITQYTDASRIELKNLSEEGVRQLREGGFDRRTIAPIQEEIAELIDDYDFWKYQSNSLAVLATVHDLRSFRLPNKVPARVDVSDRFHLSPLVRTLSFPYSAFVLAISQGSVRLVEVDENSFSAEVSVPHLPHDLSEATGRSMPRDRAPARRLQGDEGQKVLIRQFARQVHRAIRSFLAPQNQPLILAGVREVLDIYHSVCSYPHRLEEELLGNFDRASVGELAEMARDVLSREYQRRIRDLQQRFSTLQNQLRTSTDLEEIAQLATYGAVDTVLIDIESSVPGNIDALGAVSTSANPSASSYDLVSEIAARVFFTGGKLVGTRAGDLPGRSPAAAILRYSIATIPKAA